LCCCAVVLLYSFHVCKLRDPRFSQCCDEVTSLRGMLCRVDT
jgi:hypothetical protein